MSTTRSALILSVAGVFAGAQFADAACMLQHPQLWGEHHHMIAFVAVSSTASISYGQITLSEGKVEAVPAPPPSPLVGLGVALVVNPAQPPDNEPIVGRRMEE